MGSTETRMTDRRYEDDGVGEGAGLPVGAGGLGLDPDSAGEVPVEVSPDGLAGEVSEVDPESPEPELSAAEPSVPGVAVPSPVVDLDEPPLRLSVL